jgi:exodeoxyribonuclease V alpha subunit
LKELYRQGIDSNIISLAHDINKGIVNEELFNVKPDLDFIYTEDIVKQLSNIAKIYKDASYNDFQVLVPMYKGINGIDNYNKILQDIINPKSKNKKEIVVGDVIYREGDKILQLINMPDERIFNGDIGTIVEIDNKEITVDFDINTVTFTPSNYSSFKHGYAISIHKSQGSEFDTVVLPVSLSYSKMLYRKLYYTAVTRSKKKLIVIGDINALKKSAENNSQDIRMTTIKDKIIKKYSI